MSVSILAGLHGETLPFPFSWKIETTEKHPALSGTLALRSMLARQDPKDIPGFLETYKQELRPHRFHVHDHTQITMITKGTLVYVFDKNAVVLRKGDIMMLNAMVPHTWVPINAESERYQIGFFPGMFSADNYSQAFLPYFQLLFSQNYPFIHITERDRYYPQLKGSIESIGAACTDKCFSYDSLVHMHLLAFSEYMLLSLPDFSNLEQSTNNENIAKALDYIHLHLSEELSGTDVANHIGLNASYFSTCFKKHLGISFKQYVITHRISKAASLLQHTDKSITHILYECGFSSISAFYDAFHKVYSMSPDSFRKLFTSNLREKPDRI